MGLAPYGKPRYKEKIYKLLHYKSDGSFQLNLDYFSYHYSLKNIYTKKFEELFGTKNSKPEEIIPYYADIAASIQEVLEEILLQIVEHIYKKTKLDYLCYAGGVALNSKANWTLINKSKFKEFFIQPAAGDSGGALGAALWAYHSVLGNKRTFVMTHAYFGDSETPDETKTILDKANVKYRNAKNEELLIEEISEKMQKGKVIGWVQGEFEWGPRALGHRSILADPRAQTMKDIVNSKIKFREGFRPFAPSAAFETADKFFGIGKKKSQQPFGFMLYVVPVVKDKREHLGAITHVDGTARPQLVTKEINPLYHKLITSFGKKTGIPVILNTSFNLKGEPIVNTTKEALSTFKRSGIDTLVVGNFVIEKK